MAPVVSFDIGGGDYRVVVDEFSGYGGMGYGSVGGTVAEDYGDYRLGSDEEFTLAENDGFENLA